MTRKRIAACIRYDGSGYHGWQVQKGLSTVQAKVEKAFSFVANHPVHVYCAGRTDAGVHATSQIIHFDTDAERSQHAWVFGANSNLPHDISVVWTKEVSTEFHARFSATGRRYRYIVYNNSARPGILRHAVGWWYRPLSEGKILAAAQSLLGEHDFSSFRGAGCQAHSPIRTINELTIKRQRSLLVIEIHANAFLLHMVRNIAGVLFAIGDDDRPVEWAKEVLEAKDRTQAGVTVSPAGLYLVEVDYPKKFDLPRVPIGPFFLP